MSEAETSPLDRLSIPEPCPMVSALARGERADRRYCEQCDKHVVNLGALTRAQAEAELERAETSGTRLCARIVRDIQTGKVLTLDDLPSLTQRLKRTRPAHLAAALALSLLQWSCSEPNAAEEETLNDQEMRLLLEFGGYMCE